MILRLFYTSKVIFIPLRLRKIKIGIFTKLKIVKIVQMVFGKPIKK